MATDPILVLDTSVIVDMFLEARPRHALAVRLAHDILKHGVKIRLPMHALLEIRSAISSEQLARLETGTILFARGVFEEANPLVLDIIPIDEQFITKYNDPAIPSLRAGDFPFVAIAKVEGIPLVTEDNAQQQACKAAGAQVYSIAEYLAKVVA